MVSELTICKRWKRMLRDDPKLRKDVEELGVKLLRQARNLVDLAQTHAVIQIFLGVAIVPVRTEPLSYVA